MFRTLCFFMMLGVFAFSCVSFAFIVDHTCTDLTQIPQSAIEQAKTSLHIAYGHTSHGSQLTDGMSGLVAFANGGGLGLSLPTDIFAWNNGGSGGALDLDDYAMAGDVGYYPDWVNNTIVYLDKRIVPFSFLWLIFIDKSIPEYELKQIIEHEKVHTSQ